MTTTDTVTFEGIDNFNRPVFKSINKDSKGNIYRYGYTALLFDQNTTKKEINTWFNPIEKLTYFGHAFNCEPTGGEATVNII